MSNDIQEYEIKWKNLVPICFDRTSTMFGNTGKLQVQKKKLLIFLFMAII